MAPFTGSMAFINDLLMSYAEGCVMLILFGFWPGVVVWQIVRRLVRHVEARQPVAPYLHVEHEPEPQPDLGFPGAERLKLPLVTPRGTVVPST